MTVGSVAHVMRFRGLSPVVVAEVLMVILFGGLAWWCWRRGVIVTVHRGVDMSRIEGSWWASAVSAATLAGLLLLDAGRRATRKSHDSVE